MILYHGSINKFEKFSYDFCNKNAGSDEGYGFYFTDNKDIALRYAQNGFLYSVSIELNKSISDNKITLSISEIKNLLLSLHEEIDILNDFADVSYNGIEYALDIAIDTLSYNDTDIDIICELCNVAGDKETVLKAISKMGYNHILSKNNKYNSNGENVGIYVIFDNDSINILNVEWIQ